MAKRKKKTYERLIIWRNGRAYGDFRSYKDVGGSREALAEPGKTWGTTDADIANFAVRCPPRRAEGAPTGSGRRHEGAAHYSRFQVRKEMRHGGAQLVNRIYGHAQRVAHRSEAVEYRVEQHGEELGARLADLVKEFVRAVSKDLRALDSNCRPRPRPG